MSLSARCVVWVASLFSVSAVVVSVLLLGNLVARASLLATECCSFWDLLMALAVCTLVGFIPSGGLIYS